MKKLSRIEAELKKQALIMWKKRVYWKIVFLELFSFFILFIYLIPYLQLIKRIVLRLSIKLPEKE